AGSDEDVAIVSDHGAATLSREDNGLTLTLRVTLASKESTTIWGRLPDEWPSPRAAELATASGAALLNKPDGQWDGIRSRGARGTTSSMRATRAGWRRRIRTCCARPNGYEIIARRRSMRI